MERKRFLAVVMTVMMVISMIPSMVFAAAPSGELGGRLKIKGLAAVGTTVSADYSKVTPEGVTDEDFTFSWSRQTGEKDLTQVGTEKTYMITQDDLGYKLVLDLTPTNESGLTGKLSAKTVEVAATEEEAKAAAEQAAEAEDEKPEETAAETEGAQLEEDTDESEKAQLEETTDEDEGNSENQEADGTEVEQQDNEDQATEGYLEETTEAPDDSQMKIYTEEQLQVDENGNEQKDDKTSYEATAFVEDSEEQICDFGTLKGDPEDTEARYVQITNTGSETLNFQEISPEHFMVQDITEPLKSGESVSVWIQPREELEPGEYDDMITYHTEEGAEVSFEAKVESLASSASQHLT